MAMTPNQINAVVNAVCKRAESMVDNRVGARQGTPADKRKVKVEIAARLTK